MDDEENGSLEDDDENDTSGITLPSVLKASTASVGA